MVGMSKQNAPDGPNRISHITGSVNWQRWHFAADLAKDRLAELINEAAQEFYVRIFAFALMSNHFHLVAQSPSEREFRALTTRVTACRHRRSWPPGHQKSSVRSQFMSRFRSKMSRECQRDLGVEGRFWTGQYDARAVDSALSFAIRIAYDHRNPVKAKLVTAPEDYAWSSARSWLSGAPCGIEIALDPLPFNADPATLHRAVLAYQGSSALDGAEGLSELLKARDCGDRELSDLLRERGIPLHNCGTDAAV